MCGRFSQERPASELAEIFAAEPLADELGPRWNVAPTDEAFVVVQREDRRAVVAYRWGLIPHWAESAKVGSRMFNARAETLSRSPAFGDAFRRKRCLVPVDGFYEWQRIGSRRQPFTIGRARCAPARPGRALGGLAGPGEGCRRPDVHDRDDPPERADGRAPRPDAGRPAGGRVGSAGWIRSSGDPGELQGLFEPTDEVALRIDPVADLVNNVRNDGPELIRPIDPAELARATAEPPGLFDEVSR